MATPRDIRWSLIAKARRRIATGVYEDPEIRATIEESILSRTGPGSLLADLEACPIGDGDAYRDITAEVLVFALDGAVDEPMARREFPARSGRGDLDLPIGLKGFDQHPILADWRRRYDMCSLLVEVKNEKSKATAEDVRQLRCYLEDAGLGNVGMLVCRFGFGRKVMKELGEIARSNEKLILPLKHEDLKRLMQLREDQVSIFLHRKEILLRQAA